MLNALKVLIALAGIGYASRVSVEYPFNLLGPVNLWTSALKMKNGAVNAIRMKTVEPGTTVNIPCYVKIITANTIQTFSIVPSWDFNVDPTCVNVSNVCKTQTVFVEAKVFANRSTCAILPMGNVHGTDWILAPLGQTCKRL
jgi:hypothetical protein